jgi:hypothetical protein
MTNVEPLQRDKQPTLSIRTRTKAENLPSVIGEGYGMLAEYLKSLGELLADVPYVAYHNFDMQDLDVEIGFPVSKALPKKGEIKSGFIPRENVFSACTGAPTGKSAPCTTRWRPGSRLTAANPWASPTNTIITARGFPKASF